MVMATIKATVKYEKQYWVAIFERQTKTTASVAKHIFGKEPTDAQLYDYVLKHYDQLRFSAPTDFKLVVKRQNPKRVKREVRNEMEKVKRTQKSTSLAQDMLRVELEKNKKLKKTQSKAEKEAAIERKFQLKQAKRKKKQKGH